MSVKQLKSFELKCDYSECSKAVVVYAVRASLVELPEGWTEKSLEVGPSGLTDYTNKIYYHYCPRHNNS